MTLRIHSTQSIGAFDTLFSLLLCTLGIVQYRNNIIDSLATLPAVRTIDLKMPAIGNEGKFLGFLASLESLAADLMAFFVNATLVQGYIYGKNNSC